MQVSVRNSCYLTSMCCNKWGEDIGGNNSGVETTSMDHDGIHKEDGNLFDSNLNMEIFLQSRQLGITNSTKLGNGR